MALLVMLPLYWLTACSGASPLTSTPVVTAEMNGEETSVPTATVALPTPTQEPLAALVNGEGILLATFDAELARYQSAFPEKEIGDTERQRVLDSLIDTQLLAQGAEQSGFKLIEEELDARLVSLVENSGGQETFQTWLIDNFYDELSFRDALRLNAAAAWMRDNLAATVNSTAEQVHARQIFLYNSEDAKNVLERLDAGTEFVTIAAQTDPIAAGELGWFPRGYLLEPKIEDAAFALQAGEYSQVIETDLGYHIIQVIERQENRPLDVDALHSLQRAAVRNWLQEKRASSNVSILLP